MHRNSCRVCDGRAVDVFLDLGRLPLANRFLRPEQLGEPEPMFPLRVGLCRDCGLVQLDEDVPRETLFRDYVYVSGTSELVRRHADRLAKTLSRRLGLGSRDLVLEAASNDGLFLQAFHRHGVRVLGVEPAANIAARARADGVDTVAEFFDAATAARLRREHGPARLFLARHVLAHVSDLHGFLAGVKEVLAKDGVALIEVPHAGAMVDRLAFDTIYHEHLCYFSLAVLQRLFARFGLAVVDATRLPIHGGSLLVEVAHDDGPYQLRGRVERLLERERQRGLAALATWRRFAKRVVRLREEVPAFLDQLRANGLRLAGYGAPAKGNTLLCYCGIGTDRLPYLVDKSPFKQGLLTPGQHLPVHDPRRLLEDRPDAVLILAWNFAEEIVAQQAEYRRCGGRFIVPVPRPRFLDAQAVSEVVPT
jgi:novobiocin biosynthesis protein NovU/D-mycarose 3-C-methyltransferase